MMSSEEAEETKVMPTDCEFEEVKDELLVALGESTDINENVSSTKENKSEVSSMSKCRLPELLKTPAQRFYSNITGNNRAAKEITSNRENVKDIKPAVTQNESFGAVGTHRQDCKDEHKPSNTYESSSTDDVSIGIDESRSVRFRNNIFVAIEELRIQRTLEVENEEKIKTLMTEKHEMERRKEEEMSKNNALLEQHTQMEIDLKKRQEDRLLQYEEDKAKHAMAADCAEKELKVLKDEVRALHLVKYNLEKKIKEQDRLIQLQNSARDSHESQISVLEQRSKKALDKCTQLAEHVEKTESNVAVASRFHRKLMYTNEHQKCLLQSCKRDLECKKFELVALKATVAQKKDSSSNNAEKERSRADALERELQMQNEVCRKWESQLEDSRKENEKLMQSLEEAHKLLDRHVQSINKHCELEAVAHLELDETKTECHTLKESLEKEQQEKLSLEETLETRTAEWNDQKKALESRLEDLQREYDSLSEAHNSLEQLNSNWSEQNMEQKTKIESMKKELGELSTRLAQGEENIQTQKGIEEELKKTHSNEIASLKETLQQARDDFKSQTQRAESIESRCSVLQGRVRDLENEIIDIEKENAVKKKEFTDTTSQTEDSFHEQVSSLHLKLLRAEQSCKTQVERADYLGGQCALLKEKVADLFQKVTQTEGKEIKTTEATSTGVQTDDTSKITLDEPHSGVCSASRVVSIVTEMFKPVADGKSLIGDSHVEGQFKDEKCNKDVNPTSRKCETFEGNLTSTGANNDDLENCGGVKLDQKSLEDHQNISESTLVVTTSDTDVSNKTFPSKVLSSSTVFEEASVESQCNRKNNSDSGKDSTDLLKNNETFLGLESSLADEKNGSISKTCLVVDAGDETSTRKNSKTSADPICQEKDSPSDSTSFSHQVKVSGKRVRFNLEENKPSGTQPSSSSAEITTKEPQMMFSDDEDGDNGCSNIDEDVSQRINRIQNLLRSDRLRTNRKRKYPVV